MKKRYLITGATGFVGSWVTKALVQNGHDVSILVRAKKRDWRLQNIVTKLNIYECDLTDPQLPEIISQIKPHIVLHLAALGALPSQNDSFEQLFNTNVIGITRLINETKKYNLTLFINTGSSSEYGLKNKSMRETDILMPINDYGVSKAAATLYCQKIAKTENIPIITFRLFSPYGYNDEPKRLIVYVINQALRNKPISLSAKYNVRDFIYIEDVVTAYLNAEKSTIQPGDIFNIGSGKQHSVYDIVEHIRKITLCSSKITWNTMPSQNRQIEPEIWQADITKAKKLLSWQPETSLHSGLQKTITYYKTTI